MSLLNQNNPKKGKKGNKNQKPGSQGDSKFIPKPGPAKPGGFSQRPHKAGGTRGS